MRDTAGEIGTSSKVMYSCGPLHMDEQWKDVQLETTYGNSMPIRDIALRTCWKQWTIGKCRERGSEISILIGRHDEDDDSGLCSHTCVQARVRAHTHTHKTHEPQAV